MGWLQELSDAWNDVSTEAGKMGKAIWDATKEGINGIDGLVTATTSLYGSFSTLVAGVEKTVAINESLIDAYIGVAKKTLYLEQRNAKLAKTFGISISKGLDFGSVLQKQALQFKATGEQMQEYAEGIRRIIPTMNQAALGGNDTYKSLIRTQQILTTNLGLTEEQAEKFSGYAGQNERSIAEQLKSQFELANSIEQSTGLQGSFRMITEGIAEMTEDVQMQYGKIPGNLELAVLKAKHLGLNMSTLYNTGKKLLNIEESIGDELEYQLLSGRRLVDTQGKSLTNSYREATLMGDANKQANVLNKILEQEGDTLRTNMFAREQMSKLLGMDEAALSRALQKKSILEKLPGGEALFDKTGDALLAAAKGMGASADDLQTLADQEDTRTTDQLMRQDLIVQQENNTVLKEILANQLGYQGPASKQLQTTGTAALKGAMVMPTDKATLQALGIASLSKTAVKEAIINAKNVILQSDAKTRSDGTPTVNGNDFIVSTDGVNISPDPNDVGVFFKPGGPIEQGMNTAASSPAATTTRNNDMSVVLTAMLNELKIQTSELRKGPNKLWSGTLGGNRIYG